MSTPPKFELVTDQKLASYDDVIPQVSKALDEVSLDIAVTPGENQSRILKAIDSVKLIMVDQTNELNRILVDGITALTRSPSIGVGEQRDTALFNAMKDFIEAIKRRANRMLQDSAAFDVLRKRSEELTKERDELIKRLDQSRQTESQCTSDKEELTRQLKQIQTELDRMTTQNELLRSKEDDRQKKLLEQCEREKNETKLRLETQFNDFEEQLRDCRAEKSKESDRATNAETQAARLQSELDTATNSIDALKRDLTRAKEDATNEKKKSDSLERDVREFEKRVRILEDTIETLRGDNGRLDGRVKDLETQISSDASKTVRESSEAKALAQQVKQLTEELRKLEEECGKNTDVVEDLQDDVKKKEEEIKRLEQEEAEKKKIIDELDRKKRETETKYIKTVEENKKKEEEIRKYARATTPAPAKGEQWQYKIVKLITCQPPKSECPPPNGKLFQTAKYNSSTAPPSIQLEIDTTDSNRTVPVKAFSLSFKDGTEGPNDTPVAYQFTPTDGKPALDKKINVNITSAKTGEPTTIVFFGYDIDMKLDKPSFDPLFLKSKGQSPVITAVIENSKGKTFRDSVALNVDRWNGSSVALPPPETAIVTEAPSGSIPFAEAETGAELSVDDTQLTYSFQIPEFDDSPDRRVNQLYAKVSEQRSPARLLTEKCSTNKDGIPLLDDTLFSTSSSGIQGLRQNTTVIIVVKPYNAKQNKSATQSAIEYTPPVVIYNPDDDNKLTITIFLCKGSNLEQFDAVNALYTLTLTGESRGPPLKKLFIEKISRKKQGTAAAPFETVTRNLPTTRRVVTINEDGGKTTTTTTTSSSSTQRRSSSSKIGTKLTTSGSNNRAETVYSGNL